MAVCILHLGSNIADRRKNIETAYEQIEKEIGKITKKSKLYQTAPWGNKTQDKFLNSAILTISTLNPFEILQKINSIEKTLGRRKKIKWGPRIIDIDIIFYDDLILQSEFLNIPHPHYNDRNFVLLPLFEIIPFYKDPISSKTITQLTRECTDKSKVELYLN